MTSRILPWIVAAAAGIAPAVVAQSTPASWADAWVVRVGQPIGLSERRVVTPNTREWMSGIELRVRNDNVSNLHLGFSRPGNRPAEWRADAEMAGDWRAELRCVLPYGYAIVGFAARCHNDNASRMCVFYRSFDGDRLSGPVLYRVYEHRSGQSTEVERGYDRPGGYVWEVISVDRNSLLIGVGLRVRGDNFVHLDATYATPM